jgi:aminopeptidase N
LAADADARVLARTDELLAGPGGAITPLRRLVLEQRDGVVRALAAQARDEAAGRQE